MFRRPIKATVIAPLLSISILLGGCSGSNLLTQLSTEATDAPKMRVTQSIPMVSLHPVSGPPPAVADAIARGLNEIATRQNVALVIDSDIKTQTAVIGFLVVKPEARETKVSFVWDVLDAEGARINRISGEEIYPTPPGTTDAWQDMPPAAIKSMSEKVIAAVAQSARR